MVADIGAGSGYFSLRLSRALPQGQVIAADTDPRLVRWLAQRARREGPFNLSAQPGGGEEPALSRKVDLALLVDTYRYIRHRERYFRGARAALRPGGRLAIIDFRAGAPLGSRRRQRSRSWCRPASSCDGSTISCLTSTSCCSHQPSAERGARRGCAAHLELLTPGLFVPLRSDKDPVQDARRERHDQRHVQQNGSGAHAPLSPVGKPQRDLERRAGPRFKRRTGCTLLSDV
ncbi:MAG TPA: class I SAM-dependent methyltransferase [Burkholderiales bacterium]|nr:class I SAM-dependent methyltransferase [Burkholderiales bacterium]